MAVPRALIERNLESGVFAVDVDTRLRLEDTVVWDTDSETAAKRAGRGLTVRGGGDGRGSSSSPFPQPRLRCGGLDFELARNTALASQTPKPIPTVSGPPS